MNETEVLETTMDVSDDQTGEVVPDVDETSPEASDPAEVAVEETPEQDFEKIDPTKLPPEQQKFYKGMQASFTKKMQTLQSVIEGLDPHKERLSIMDKAIAGDTEARAHLARIAGEQKATTPQKVYEYEDVPESFESTKDLVKFYDGRINQGFQNMLKYIQEQVLPQHLQPVAQLQQKATQERIQGEIQVLQQKYPDFDSKIDAMVEARKTNPHLGIEEAYKLVSWKPQIPVSKTISKPGARPAAVSDVNANKAMSWEEAFEAAKKSSSRR